MKRSDSLLIIDGFNVLHAVVLTGRDRAAWWHPAAQRRLVERVEQLDSTYPVICIVFDRRRSIPEGEEGVTSEDPRITVRYAPSADDWIVAEVDRCSPQWRVTVVTADRLLRERVQRAGGTTKSPTAVFGDSRSIQPPS
jgi:predicted RNA-binding protein with PIN domain